MKKERWAIYQCGYVAENGNEFPDWISHIIYQKPQHVSDDMFAVKQIHDGIEYVDVEESKILGEWFENVERTVNVEICSLQEQTDNADLNSNIHLGFTIGRGNKMYFLYNWHRTGNVTVYPIDGGAPRWLPGDTVVKIHFK